jgi:DNA-binding SARP family transcriptional activator
LALTQTRNAALPAVVLGLLGGWKLVSGGNSIDAPHSVERVTAFLAIAGATPRSTVAGRLWPDFPEERAHGNLRSAIWRANRLGPELLREQSGRLSLAADIEIDIDQLHHAEVAEPRATPELDIGAITTGELLPGWYEDWVLVERERLRQKQLHALEAFARRLVAQNKFAEAVDAALAAISAEPLRESAHRVLIEVHLAEGNLGEARRAYQSLRSLLEEELGVEPSEALRTALGGHLLDTLERPLLQAAKSVSRRPTVDIAGVRHPSGAG